MRHTDVTRRNYLMRLFVTLALLFLIAIGPSALVQAASLTVTITTDEITTNGQCSLREAIISANTDAAVGGCPAGDGADTILLPAGTFTLSITGRDEDDARTGDLDLKDQLTITGAGAGTSIIDGGALDRIFDVRDGATLTISGVTMRNGSAIDASGGGLRNNGMLTLKNSTIKESSASLELGGYGAGRGGGISNVGSMTLTNSTVADNTAQREGGGISNTGKLTISSSTASGNTSMLLGGAIYNEGALVIQQSTVVRSNQAGFTDGGDGVGGGVCNLGILHIADSTVRNNSANYAGGVYNAARGTAMLTATVVRMNRAQAPGSHGGGVENYGKIQFERSTVMSNTVIGEGAAQGGGLYNAGAAMINSSTVMSNVLTVPAETANQVEGGGIWNDGTLIVSGSSIRGNTAAIDSLTDPGFIRFGSGGGIHSTGTLSLTSSTVSNNRARVGGGLWNAGTMIVKLSTTRDNRAESGGGMYNSNSLTVSESTISGNFTNDFGGGIDNDRGTLRVVNSTIANNHSFEGGGINNSGNSTATIINSTITGNTGVDLGGGIYNLGDFTGGVNTGVNTVDIQSSTIAYNRTPGIAGAGISNRGGPVTMRNSILAENIGPENRPDDLEGVVISEGYNLIQTVDAGQIVGNLSGNRMGVAPKLGPLQNNGGPTWTHALLTGSPAIDNANPAAPGSGAEACPMIDQRGYARPRDGDGDGTSRCDMGAYERQSASTVYTPWGESDHTDAPAPDTPPAPVAEPPLTPDPEMNAAPAQIETNAGATLALPYISAPAQR